MPDPILPPPSLTPPPPPSDIDFQDSHQEPAPALDRSDLFVADGPAAAHFVWKLASDGLPEERVLPKEDQTEPRAFD